VDVQDFKLVYLKAVEKLTWVKDWNQTIINCLFLRRNIDEI
jgi:hypothetical protein